MMINGKEKELKDFNEQRQNKEGGYENEGGKRKIAGEELWTITTLNTHDAERRDSYVKPTKVIKERRLVSKNGK